VLPPFALRTLGLSAFGVGLAMAAGGVGGLIGSLAATRLGARFGGLPVPNRADRRRDCDAEMISVSANPRRSEHQRTCHRRMG
jgi:hypothetical protein